MSSNLAKAAIAALLCQGALGATVLRLCLQDRADLRMPARAALIQELIRLFPSARLSPDCPGDPGALAITLLPQLSGQPSDALGAMAVRADGVIAPPILVFVNAVVAHSSAKSEEALGLALARVAGHELLHFLSQSREHSPAGLLQERLSAADLTSRSSLGSPQRERTPEPVATAR
ncbi:MAG: hypothetical protein GC160_10125 [Acidobacteria bacterium]|nr:hypothetical protein [Acidobacteriota bacterium]